MLVLRGTDKIGSPQQTWGVSRVAAYDLAIDEEVWNGRVPGSNRIGFLTANDDFVYVIGNRFANLVIFDSDTGQETLLATQTIILSDNHDIKYAYQPQGSLLSAFPKDSETMLWQQKHIFSLFVVGDSVFISKENNGDIGIVTALDGESGEILWEQTRVVSNVAIGEELAYFLIIPPDSEWYTDNIVDVQLIAVDVQTGKTIGALEFEPSGIQANYGHYHYFVAASDGIVLVYLGDGRQLFAFRYLGG